jgi:hypothetical protein
MKLLIVKQKDADCIGIPVNSIVGIGQCPKAVGGGWVEVVSGSKYFVEDTFVSMVARLNEVEHERGCCH